MAASKTAWKKKLPPQYLFWLEALGLEIVLAKPHDVLEFAAAYFENQVKMKTAETITIPSFSYFHNVFARKLRKSRVSVIYEAGAIGLKHSSHATNLHELCRRDSQLAHITFPNDDEQYKKSVQIAKKRISESVLPVAEQTQKQNLKLFESDGAIVPGKGLETFGINPIPECNIEYLSNTTEQEVLSRLGVTNPDGSIRSAANTKTHVDNVIAPQVGVNNENISMNSCTEQSPYIENIPSYKKTEHQTPKSVKIEWSSKNSTTSGGDGINKKTNANRTDENFIITDKNKNKIPINFHSEHPEGNEAPHVEVEVDADRIAVNVQDGVKFKTLKYDMNPQEGIMYEQDGLAKNKMYYSDNTYEQSNLKGKRNYKKRATQSDNIGIQEKIQTARSEKMTELSVKYERHEVWVSDSDTSAKIQETSAKTHETSAKIYETEIRQTASEFRNKNWDIDVDNSREVGWEYYNKGQIQRNLDEDGTSKVKGWCEYKSETKESHENWDKLILIDDLEHASSNMEITNKEANKDAHRCSQYNMSGSHCSLCGETRAQIVTEGDMQTVLPDLTHKASGASNTSLVNGNDFQRGDPAADKSYAKSTFSDNPSPGVNVTGTISVAATKKAKNPDGPITVEVLAQSNDQKNDMIDVEINLHCYCVASELE